MDPQNVCHNLYILDYPSFPHFISYYHHPSLIDLSFPGYYFFIWEHFIQCPLEDICAYWISSVVFCNTHGLIWYFVSSKWFLRDQWDGSSGKGAHCQARWSEFDPWALDGEKKRTDSRKVFVHLLNKSAKTRPSARHGGGRLWSKHLGGGGRWMTVNLRLVVETIVIMETGKIIDNKIVQ